MSKLSVGVIGCGGVADETHIPIWRGIDNIEIVAVCDKNEVVAKATRDKYNINMYFTELSEMLDNIHIDIVDNCTPVQLHAPISIQAMESGCHTLVEKPMALNLKAADEMINTARRKGVKLGVIHNTLFNPVVQSAKSIIKRGDAGDIIAVDVKYLKKRDDAWVVDKEHWSHSLPGGIFCEILAHPIYLEREFLGKLDVVSVYSRKFSNFDWMESDELRVILNGEKGVGTITLSINSPKNAATMDIYGTKMNLHLELWTAILIKHRPTRVVSFPTVRDSFSLGTDSMSRAVQEICGTFSTTTKLILKKVHGGHHTLIPKFVECIRNNEKPLVTAEDGREVARVLEKICDGIKK
jgi:predicted dehydrogenase